MKKSTIRVYIGDFKLVFYDETAKDLYSKEEKTTFNTKTIAENSKKSPSNLFISCKHIEEDFSLFIKEFVFIEAAGGLINNDKDQYLFIYRHDKWDLPKGKLEKKELPDKAAVRECQEECGLKQITLNGFLTNTYHIYFYKKEWAIKKTYWYRMLCNETNLTPQLEESITEVGWKNKNEIPAMLTNTYTNIIDVLKEANLLDN